MSGPETRTPEQDAAVVAWTESGAGRVAARARLADALPNLSAEQREHLLISAMRESGDEPELVVMNEEGWFVLDESGSMSVARFAFDDVANRERLVRYSIPEFRLKMRKRKMRTGGQVADAWLEWPRSAEKNRTVFIAHGHVPADALNLWRGFGVQPNKTGSWERIDKHIHETVCGEDPVLTEFLYGWMARMVQRPQELAGSIVTLKGKEGVGKSVVAALLRRIMGSHAITVNSPKQLVGDFNGHLEGAVLVEASEALFAGDRTTANKLKSITTDPVLPIERKGRDAIQARNLAHILMTTNETWAVPAGPESRRFFVLEVSEKHRGDQKYFDALWAEVNSDEAVGAFLQELLDFDLSTFKHHSVPVTDALREQRERSATGVVAWGLSLAADGGVVRTRAGSMPWRAFWTTRELYEDYQERVGGQRFERVMPLNIFAGDLKRQLGLRQARRAPASVTGIPELARGQRGFEVPATVREWEQLVREAGGVLDGADEEDAEGSAQAA